MIELSMINYLNNILLLLSGIWISGFWFPVCLSSRAANKVFTIKEKAPTTRDADAIIIRDWLL